MEKLANYISELRSGKKAIAVIGLGYTGLSLATELGKAFRKVVGFDTDKSRVEELTKGFDRNKEILSEDIKNVEFVSETKNFHDVFLYFVAVPTPISKNKLPDLSYVKQASETVGRCLSPGSVVVYECTVYPGVTEEICKPIIEKTSGLVCDKDFKLGYSPERINFGDRFHRLSNTKKIVSGRDKWTCDFLAEVYGHIVKAGVYKAPNIKTAEAAKIIENVQRDLNVALMNEFALIFNKLGLDTQEVLRTASTKWNFAAFEPGLVGGHCIGVDPYYLAFKATEAGHYPELILAGRRINESISTYVTIEIIKELTNAGKVVRDAKLAIFGIAFKENVADTRNSKVLNIIEGLNEYGISVYVYDPLVSKEAVLNEWNSLKMKWVEEIDTLKELDGIIIAVKHDIFSNISLERLKSLCGAHPVLFDVKGICCKEDATALGFKYWRL